MLLSGLGGVFTVVLFAWLSGVRGNTEIVNFSSVLSPAVDVDAQFLDMPWEKLDAKSVTREFELTLAPYKQSWSEVCKLEECQHEIFVKLGLDQDHDKDSMPKGQPRYSLRISWPASTPANFDIELYTPVELYYFLSSRFSSNRTIPTRSDSSSPPSQTRVMYARIRARDAGVRAPLHRMWYFFPPLVPLPSDPPTVNFHLVVDPLLLGFIPKSVVPTIRMILGAIVIGLCSVRRLTMYLEAVAMRAITRVEVPRNKDHKEE